MKGRLFPSAVILLALLFTTAWVVGCEKQGPMEKAGEKIDEAAETVQEDIEKAADELDNDGPIEESAEEIDEALEEAGEAVEDAAQ